MLADDKVQEKQGEEGRQGVIASPSFVLDLTANFHVDSCVSSSEPSCSVEVVEQPVDNLLLMIRQEREGLLKGPQITIFVGSTAIEGIFKRAAMASSSVLNKHFVKHPESTEFRFQEDSISPHAIKYLFVTWMPHACTKFKAYVVPILDNFAKNVALLRAARLLGMGSYTEPIFGACIEYLKTELPTYEEIAIIEKNTTSSKDRLWTTMVSTQVLVSGTNTNIIR